MEKGKWERYLDKHYSPDWTDYYLGFVHGNVNNEILTRIERLTMKRFK